MKHYHWLVTSACGRNIMFKKGTIVNATPPKDMKYNFNGVLVDIPTIRNLERRGYLKRVNQRNIMEEIDKLSKKQKVCFF